MVDYYLLFILIIINYILGIITCFIYICNNKENNSLTIFIILFNIPYLYYIYVIYKYIHFYIKINSNNSIYDENDLNNNIIIVIYNNDCIIKPIPFSIYIKNDNNIYKI